MTTPRLEINLSKIEHNLNKLRKLFHTKNINITGVTKGVCGDPVIAEIFVKNGISTIADSRIENIIRMRDAGISAQFILLRTPILSQVDSIIKNVDISFNSELSIIKKLSLLAIKYKCVHKIILMIELGDLREGIMPIDLEDTVKQIIRLKGIQIIGIGTTLACLAGIKPDIRKMDYLSSLADRIEKKFKFTFEFVSGGNSANYYWFNSTNNMGKINNLRLGEAIYLGRETLYRKEITGLYTDAFSLVAEVIESKMKPSMPKGEICQNAFGELTKFTDQGNIRRVILGVGRQDVNISGLKPNKNVEILGSSSDHVIVNAKKEDLQVGDEVKFEVDYGAMLTAMTSSYVLKKFI